MKRVLVVDRTKLKPLVRSKNAFASLARSILYQQLSGKAASAIERKFFGLFHPNELKKEKIPSELIIRKFPKPEDILSLSDVQFRSVGISTQKAGYLRDLSLKFLDGTIVPRKFPKMTDEEIIEHVVSVKGIGVWSAHMFLIFALNRPNVLPAGDLGIKKGFKIAFGLKSLPDEKKMRLLAKPHEGDYTYLSLYLWYIADGGDWNW